MSSFTSTVTAQQRANNGPPKKEIWSSLLNSVSSGKRLAEKRLLVLGGTPESQREFISSLQTDASTSNARNQTVRPPVANDFALGYTYQDVLDTDHEDILARLSVYTLSKPSSHFIPLLRPLFTPQTIPNMLLVILLDWSDPWNWIRQLRSWVRLLHTLLRSLDQAAVNAFEDNIAEWRDKKRNESHAASSGEGAASASFDGDVALPLGPGEWDSPLGVPLSVVCQNANKIEALEKDNGWRDAHFDFVQQFLRTILLKHGGSLIYTMPHLQGTNTSSALQTLIHSSLGIQSLLQKKTLRYNTTDRDHILIPPNFDSWGKIRVLTTDFNVESVSDAWTSDISAEGSNSNSDNTNPPTNADDDPFTTSEAAPASTNASDDDELRNQPGIEAVLMWEEYIKNPSRTLTAPGLPSANKSTTGIEVGSKDAQRFLGEQAEVLDGFAKEDEKSQLVRESKKTAAASTTAGQAHAGGNGDVQEHIGNVQFNVGGIQMDVEHALQQLNKRETKVSQEQPETPKTPPNESEEAALNEKYKSFFAGLIKKPGGSAANSPRRGGE